MKASTAKCVAANRDRNGKAWARPRCAMAACLWLALAAVAGGLNSPARAEAAQSGTTGAGRRSTANGSWRFVFTGDSRNCGNVVMPAIAEGARAAGAKFFWHLGDFRALFKIDEDFADVPANPSNQNEYEQVAWQNFIENQLNVFGRMPVFLVIGNHELIRHSRDDYVAVFAKWLSAPAIARQRLRDDSADGSPKAYYHWVQQGVDFITLDNASDDRFEDAQVRWFEKLLERDERDAGVRSIVVGMHKALPGSISDDHSMSESGQDVPIQSGRQVYRDLLQAQNEFHKKVYVLASHAHFYMEGIFNTDAWKDGVLPGWIVGTGGAQLYDLPPDERRAKRALQGVYGYVVATVNPGAADGTITFEFKMLNKSDVPAAVARKFSRKLIDFCFDENMRKAY